MVGFVNAFFYIHYNYSTTFVCIGYNSILSFKETADLVTFTWEIFNGKLHFLCSECCLTQIQILLRCCLLHIAIMILRHILYLVYLCPRLGLVWRNLCAQFFIFSLIFIIINRIISLKQTHLFFANVLEYLISPWAQDVNWMYIRRSEDVQDVFWTSYSLSNYVLCPGRLALDDQMNEESK